MTRNAGGAAVDTVVRPDLRLVLGREEDGLGMVHGVCLDARCVKELLHVAHLHHVTVDVSADLNTFGPSSVVGGGEGDRG